MSLYQSLGLVQNFVEITQGSITSEPFDEEIETSITIRRVRSGLLTLVKNWIFDDPFNKKMTSIGYFGASDDQIIRIRYFFEEIGI